MPISDKTSIAPLALGSVLLFALLLLSLALGRRLLHWLGVETSERWERALFACGLGMGALSFLPFLLFLSGVGTPPVIRGAVAILAVALLPDIYAVLQGVRSAWRTRRRFTGLERWIFGVFGTLVLLVFFRALCPVTDDDGLSYHLSASVRFLDAGRFYLLPTLTYTNWTLGIESLFALLLAAHPEAPVGLVQFTFGLILCAGAFLLARRLYGGFTACAMLALLPLYTELFDQMSQAHVDVGLAAFALLSVFALLQGRSLPDADPQRRRWFVVSALFAGLAACAKLTGVMVILALATVLLLTPFDAEESPIRHRAHRTLLFALIAGCVAAPWSIRTALVTGNPLYPMFFDLFGGREWTAQGWSRIQHYFLLLSTLPGLPPTRSNLLLARGLMLCCGLILCLATFRATRRSPYAVPARYAAVFVTLVLTGSGYNLRFLMAAFPVAVIALARALFQYSERAGVYALCALALLLAIRAERRYEPPLDTAFSVALGRISREAYLRGALADYPVVQFVNQNLPADARILVGTWEESNAYYRPMAMRANYWLQDSIHYDTPERLTQDLRRLGVTHLVLRPMEPWCAKSYVCSGREAHETRALTALAARSGLRLYEANGVSLYRLTLPTDL